MLMLTKSTKWEDVCWSMESWHAQCHLDNQIAGHFLLSATPSPTMVPKATAAAPPTTANPMKPSADININTLLQINIRGISTY